MPRLMKGEKYTPQTRPVRVVRRSSAAQHQGRSPGPQERQAVARATPRFSSQAQHQGRAPGPRERRAVQQATKTPSGFAQGGGGLDAGLFGGLNSLSRPSSSSLAARILLGSDAAGETESRLRRLILNALAGSSTGRGLEQAQLRSDFEKSKGSLAKGAKAPTVHFIPGLIQKGMGAYVGGDLPRGHIGIDASYARSTLPLVNQYSAGRGAFLHELAHQSQPTRMFNPKGGEGKYTDAGAEAFKVRQAPRLGFDAGPVTPGLEKQTSAFLRRYGLKGVSGQFKGQT